MSLWSGDLFLWGYWERYQCRLDLSRSVFKPTVVRQLGHSDDSVVAG